MAVVGTFAEMRETEGKIIDFSVDGKCSGCGNCCTRMLPLSSKEISRIRKYIVENDVKEQKFGGVFVDPVVDWTCPFRSEREKKCLIYPVRPGICRDFLCCNGWEVSLKRRRFYESRYYTVDLREVFYG